MADNKFIRIKDRIMYMLRRGTKPGTNEQQARMGKRERVIVYTSAYIIALSLWLIVNLNGTFNVTIRMPVVLGTVPADKALTSELPGFVEVDMTGSALPLISLFNNPPAVMVAVDSRSVNVFNQVRQQMSMVQEVEVLKVEPMLIQVNLEDKISKKVPVRLATDLSFENRFGLLGTPRLVPDSILISGAASKINEIDEWVIKDTLRLSKINDNIAQNVRINSDNPLIETSVNTIAFQAEVSEYTESETSVLIRTRDLPRGESINYTPSYIVIKYDVPLKQYEALSQLKPYEAYVSYEKIKTDLSGFVSPDIELLIPDSGIKLRSFQPKVVAYYSVLDE